MTIRALAIVKSFWLVCALASIPASAESVKDFYKDKTLRVYVGYSAGGGYDTYGRTVARHWGKHIPGNPTVVVMNRPGAGGLVLTNELFNILPKDGTAVGVVAHIMAMGPLLGDEKAKYDPRKFGWIGSANKEVSVCAAWHTTPVQTFKDLLTQEMVIGGTGPGGTTNVFPNVLNNVLGTRFKVVLGYPGLNDILLAMERGEVAGTCGFSWSTAKSRRPEWIENNRIRVLVQTSLEKHPELPNAPLITDLADDPDDKKTLEVVFASQLFSRPFLAPPDVPADRLEALRDAFIATMKDPAFLAEAEKQNLEINPLDGSRIDEVIDDMYKVSPDAVRRIREVSGR